MHRNDQTTRSFNPNLVIVVSAFAAFLSTFNETYLNVAFSPIMDSLAIGVDTVQWLATGYMLGAAVMVPISAFAYRSLPTRPLFCGSLSLLVSGSVIAAVAPNFAILLTGRFVQAIGTGMIIPIGMNITLEVAPRQKLGTYMGIMGAMTTLGPSISVILAGVILSVAPWRVLFWVFAAMSGVCLVLSAIILRNIAELTHPHLDVFSVILAGIGLIALLYGISTSFTGNLAIAIVCMVAGIGLLAAFVLRQKKLAEPLIDLRPLAIKPFTISMVGNMLALIVIFAMNILVPTFMQSVLGTPSLTASLTLCPAILLACVISPIVGRIFDKHGAKILLPLGFSLMAVFAICTSLIIPIGNSLLLALCYIPVIAGSACVIGPIQSFALSKLSHELHPYGVTVMSTGFQVAGCIGSSVFVGIYAGVIAGRMGAGINAFAASQSAFFAAGIAITAVAVFGLVLALWIRAYEVNGAKANASDTDASAIVPAELVPDSTLRSLMKTDVFTLDQNATVADALRLFVDRKISGAPVVNGSGAPIAFLSDGDIMRYLADQTPGFKSVYSTFVERENEDFGAVLKGLMEKPALEVARDHVITVDASASMGEVAHVLASHHLKKAPVMEAGKMVGVINRSNITKYSVNRYLEQSEKRA